MHLSTGLKTRFLTLFLAIACGISAAQSISGRVTEPDGAPVFSAIIRLQGTSYAATSDENGYYLIESIEAGVYKVIFTHLNYESDTVELTVDRAIKLNRQLTGRVSALEEIEIRGKTEAQEIREKPFEVNVIDLQPLQQRNMDVTRILTQSAGVRVRQNAGLGSSFDFTLNGFKAAQYINGIPVDVYGSAYAVNSIPANQIERMEVYKGVVPVHLGSDALGGAINIITRRSIKNHLSASYSYGAFNTHKTSVQGVYNDKTSGLTLIGSAFLNHSDNDYVMKDMEIISGTTTYKKDVRRFHDNFRSYAAKAEVGYTNKPFADALFLGAGISAIRNDIQTGSTQYPPIGEATGEEDNRHVSLRYSKQSLLNNKLDVDAFILYSNTNTVFLDTASRTYQWDGSVLVERPSTSRAGEFGDKQRYRTRQQDLTQRYNITYKVNNSQSLSFNVFSIHNYRHNTDAGKVEGTSVDDNSNQYAKLILGLGHNLTLLDNRFQSTAFVKYYRMNASIDSAARWRGGYFDRAPLETTKSFTGAGVGLSFAITDRVLVKASSEYACRLPSVYELLGDGITTVANVSLEPELSMNYNIGFSGKIIDRASTTLTWSGSGFYRRAENFIRTTTGVRRATFINFDAALVRGAESELKLSISRKLRAMLNATYQQVLDDNEFVGGTNKNYSYRVQLPNTPSLFGNLDVEYRIGNFLHEKLVLIPYYNALYVRKFYLGYENIARGDLKYTIPMQLVHDIGATLSDRSEKYSLSLQCSNLTNSLAFDNFRLQKPGRAFSLKITYNIN